MAEEVIGLLFGVDGGGAIDGRSGQKIVSDLTEIVNKINSGKSTVPKVQLKFDTSHAKTALQELKTQLQEIASMGNISVSGMSSRGGSGGSAGVKQDTANYRALTTTVKQYYAALAEVEKIQMKTTSLSSSGGVWSTTDAQYDARIQRINQLKTQFDSLGVSVNAAGVVEMNSAQQLNITEEQRAMLLAQVQSAITANGLAHEKSAAQISAAWDKNADKATQYVRRIEDVASKNADVKKTMSELLELAASGDPKNLDALTHKLAELQQKVRETGADVETFGQKLKKTFGSQLRYMLTSMVYMKALQFIRDLYNNVVELDKAMTDLQIASGKTKEEIRELTESYSKLGKRIGATTLEVAKSADTWLRQGYEAVEANTLITNSMMLSKLGQIEAAEAAKNLTSAMKGYKVSVNDSIGIVDKFTAVDMVAAASAGDMATAMAETATSAKIAGVSMDTLIGYIATVKEVTQDSAESVGTFYKTLFARMNNVAAGNFIDEETGEALNDVETVLNGLGIALRDMNGEFRNSSEVLAEVGNRWQEFDTVEKHAIATAMAGTRQQEKFIVLMENYETAMKYATTATESAGTALEKYGAYTDSIEGKMNSLKATFEEFSMTILNSDLVNFVVEFLQTVLDVMSFADGLMAKLAILTASIAVLTYATHALSAALAKQKIIIAGGFKNFLLYIQYVKAMATTTGVSTAMIDAQTAAIIRQYTTGLTGLLTFIPRLIAVLWTWIATNIKAKIANDATTASAISLNSAMQAFNINPWMLAITAIIAACAAAVAIMHEVDTAWEDTYERAKENAEKQKELVAEYEAEIESLEALQEKLEDAHGSRQKLANIYSELNSKVAVSAGLLAGEEEAYQAVNAQIQDQINAMRALRQEALATKISSERAAFDAQKDKRYGGMLQLDWSTIDASGSDMRGMMRGDTSDLQKLQKYSVGEMDEETLISLLTAYEDVGQVADLLNYEIFYEKMTQEQQDALLEHLGFTAESWKNYWDSQVATANEVFGDVINNATGTFGSSFMESVVDRLIRGGYTLEETNEVLTELTNGSEALTAKVSEYYTALAKNDGSAEGIYNELMGIFDEYIEKYPDLTNIFATLIGSICTADTEQTAFNVTLQTLSEMLEETGGAYDALTRAMEDMQTTGALTADTIQTIINDFPELLDYLEETAEGFIVADNAMANFLADIRANYLVNVMKAQQAYEAAYNKYESSDKKTEEDRKAVEAAQESLQNAIDNANNWLRTEAVLTRSTIFEEYTNLLKEQQSAIEEEYDAYKELCELRKDLLQTYQEELDYKKKLKNAQDSVTRLATRLSVSRLDTSAAGQARTRELEASLKDAQDELDDITLEHAIEILENQLESQLVQHENFIQNQIKQIEQTIRDAVKLSTDELASALEKAGGSSASANSPAGTGTANDGSSVNTDNSSYNSTVGNAQSYLDNNKTISDSNYKEPTEEEKIAAEIVQFGDAIGSGMNSGKSGDNGIIKWGGNEYNVQNSGTVFDSSTPLYKAAVNLLQFKDRQIFGYGGKVYGYLDSHIQEIEGRTMSKKGYNNFVSAMKSNYGSYHTGGLVGDIATLSASEEFAKLLKGEFVSTPAQMKRFMEETLPKIANYTTSGGSNEFNAPLIEIHCDNVTSETLPELERVVNEAVKEIQKQLDSGMSRTGFKRPASKRLI